jgi:tight adherence protein B
VIGGSWRPIGAVLGAAAAFLLLFAVLDAVFGRSRMQRRIAELRVLRVGAHPETEPLLRRLRAAGGRVVERSDRLSRLALKSEPLLDRASTDMTPPQWLALRTAVAIALALTASTILPLWVGLLLGVVAGFPLMTLLLRSRVSRRERVFADELPNTLQLILSSLRAGFTLQQSVDGAVRDDDGPVAQELRRALSESRINGDFEDALARAGERINSKEMVWLVMAIRLQREVGGSLADVMQITADTMRERSYLRRHVAALSAEGRFSAYILIAMPIGIGLLLYVTRPEYMATLFQEPLGLAMVSAAAALMLIGSFWLRASIKIEV